ncbi:MAG: electron transfer complex subunit TmcD [Desulfobacterales bacterium]
MQQRENWDWTPATREIGDFGAWHKTYDYMEEPYVSADGEKIAAIVRSGEEAYTVCVNGRLWENTFDKVWYLRFTPDHRPAALVSDTAMWTVAIDGVPWENWYEFVWDTCFANTGSHVTVAAQSELRYFAVTDDRPWKNKFLALNHLIVSPDGTSTAAVVQSTTFPEADIQKFQEGCFTVAVNGEAWQQQYVNVWELSFSADNRHVAAEIRTNLYDYTIAVDGKTWEKRFSSVWAPRFHPADNSVTAPVKIPGGWGLARDEELIWYRGYKQLWHHMYSPDGSHIAAVAAPEFGKWTIAEDDRAWAIRFNEAVTDAIYSPDGNHIACLGKSDGKWYIAVDDRIWDTAFDMAWQPVFSPDGSHVAAKVERGGNYTIFIDGHPIDQVFSAAWQPVFSPDGTRLLVKGVLPENQGGQYCRQVLEVDRPVP